MGLQHMSLLTASLEREINCDTELGTKTMDKN
jgi:hypothetical protein